MMMIDHEGMTMSSSWVMMRVAMRFRPLPALMFMLVVVVMVMQVGVLHRSMVMLERHRVP